MISSTEEENIKIELKKWIADNRSHLPINIDYWDIHISKIEENSMEEPTMLEFGKYNAKQISTSSFYKPSSRIVKV